MALLTPLVADGSETFDKLCHHFLQHEPLSRWLMNHDPYAAPQARDMERGVAFCCSFPVPTKWSRFSSCFAMGEMMVPIRTYGRFICGILVTATNFHKYAACMAEKFVPTTKSNQPNAFRTSVRRIVCDIGTKPDDVISLIDFAWMDDSSLIVSSKLLVPPVYGVRQATCTGSFAIYYNVAQRGKLPLYPAFLVSFAEVPHCTFCSAQGISSGCICTSSEETWSSVYMPPSPTPAPSSHLLSVPSEAAAISLMTRLNSINKKSTIRISMRRGFLRRDANGGARYTLNRVSHQEQITANFALASDRHMHTLRQVAAISTSFGSPANVASARLLYDAAEHDAPDEFRKRHEINTENLNALLSSEKQEPVVSSTEDVEVSPSLSYNTIDFSFDSPLISSSLTTSQFTEKTVCDKFFPYRPSVETASHDQFSPLSNKGSAQLSESSMDNSAPVTSVETFLDLTAATAPHPPPPPPPPSQSVPPRTPAPICIGSSASPVTPPIDDPKLARPVDLQNADIGAAKRVRYVPSSGVCDVCGKYFFKSGALVRHTRSAHPEVAVLPREPRSSSGSSSGGASSGGKHPTGRIDCPRCPKTFSQQGSLNRHLRSIHEARKLHCKYCDLAFGQAFDLKRHQKRKHPGSVLVVPPEPLPRFAMRERPLCEMRQQG